jgi:hypothetical protein
MRLKILAVFAATFAATAMFVAAPTGTASAQYCGMGPAGPIPPGGYWHHGVFYGCGSGGGYRQRGDGYRGGPGRRGGYGCGYGPAGPIPPGGYWHYGRYYPCPR